MACEVLVSLKGLNVLKWGDKGRGEEIKQILPRKRFETYFQATYPFQCDDATKKLRNRNKVFGLRYMNRKDNLSVIHSIFTQPNKNYSVCLWYLWYKSTVDRFGCLRVRNSEFFLIWMFTCKE